MREHPPFQRKEGITMEPNIRFDHITKEFPGVKALEDVSFEIRSGEVHALLGENGAGKSTLLNILHGVYTADGGDIWIGGKRVNFGNPMEALNFGIAKVHQEINLVPQLTVGQNIVLGFEPARAGIINFGEVNRRADEVLNSLGCSFSSGDSIEGLSAGEMQMIVIAKALFHNARIISFDEPTASLSNVEIESLFAVIEGLKAQGITILYVSHKLDEISRLADRASILRDGKYVLTCDVAETPRDELVRNMVGRSVSSYAVRTMPSCVRDETALEVRNMSGPGYSDISFTLRRGEILGFAGLVGAKRTNVVRALFGADARYEGEIYVHGKKTEIHSPRQGLSAGIGLLSENRKTEGFVGELDNSMNIALAALPRLSGCGVLNFKKILDNFNKYAQAIRLNLRDPEVLTVNLSGGNQQKVILAKWLATEAGILIFDEPTKGVDVGAKAEIYRLMEEFAAGGNSIIMVSSELPEVIGMSDRVIVMREGRIAAELAKAELSEEIILSYAMGGVGQ